MKTHRRLISIFNFQFSILLLVSLSACQKEELVTPIVTDSTGTGTVTRPEWSVEPGYDYSRSMTAVVAVDLSQLSGTWAADTADLLGAFAGEECVGVANSTAALFYLYIVAPRESSQPITLRYYSSTLQNIYSTDTSFPFENGGRQGSTASPLTPNWRIEN